MSDLKLTTKPMQSQAQWRWAFANGMPFAKRWAKQTPGGTGARFRNLPPRKKRKPYTAKSAAYAVAVLAQYVSLKDYDQDVAQALGATLTVKGEQISPGVTRIRGNLCNVHGRYGPCDKALSGKKKPSKPRKGRAPAKPKQTPELRAQERTQQRQTNIDAVAKRMAATDTGLAPGGVKALTAFAQGQQPDATMGDGMVKMGLAERADDGSYRMTPTGRAVVSAMAAGDYQRAVDAVSRGTDASGKRTERQTAAQQRQQEAATRRAAAQAKRETAERQRAEAAKKPAKAGASGSKQPDKPATERPRAPITPPKRPARSSAPPASSGGSSSSPAKPAPAQPTKEQQTADNRNAVRQTMADTDQGLAPGGFDRLIALSTGVEPDAQSAQGFIDMGLAERGTDGTLRLSSDARTVIEAANRGDAKAAIDAVSRGQERAQTRRATKAGPFTVFKDASGQLRWILRTTTAFRDRDKEILSTKALEDDAARMTATGQYGPLRYWHIGEPDPFDAAAPWGRGLDIGDCDYSTVIGRTSIESGTFKSAAIGAAIAAAATDYEASPGFFHSITEPDTSGVFHHMHRFERSLVPTVFARASNYYTGLAVGRTTKSMDQHEYNKRVGAFLSDMQAKGVPADVAAAAIAATQHGEKAADEQKVAYKAADAPQVFTAPDGTQGIIQDGRFVALKAAFVPEAQTSAPPVDAKADGGIDDATEGEPSADATDAADDLTLAPADLQAIEQIVSVALQAALSGSLTTISDKMTALDDEMKAMGYSRVKEASEQKTAVEQATATAKAAHETATAATVKVAELLGEQPAVTVGRASAAAETQLNPVNPTDAALLAAVKAQLPATADPLMSFLTTFQDAH